MSDVVLAGFNVDNPNWGCRSTSLSLDRLLRRGGNEIVYRLAKTAADAPYPIFAGRRSPNAGRPRWRWALDRAGSADLVRQSPLAALFDVIGDDPGRSAQRIVQRAKVQSGLAELVAAVRSADHLVVNAEGSLIATLPPRRDCLFFLALVALGNELGIPVHVVNGMLSMSPGTGSRAAVEGPSWWDALGVGAATVAVRDPASLRVAASLGIPATKLHLVPDALFSVGDLVGPGQAPPVAALPPWGDDAETLAVAFANDDRPTIVMSGASIPPGTGREGWVTYTVSLGRELQRRLPGHRLALAEPCTGDSFLRQAGRALSAPVVPVGTNVWAAGRFLGGAAAYVSGRYHPSILASLGGTPLVGFGSNSHKIAGLLELLGTGEEELGPYGQVPVDQVADRVELALDQPAEARRQAVQRAGALGQTATDFYSTLLRGGDQKSATDNPDPVKRRRSDDGDTSVPVTT